MLLVTRLPLGSYLANEKIQPKQDTMSKDLSKGAYTLTMPRSAFIGYTNHHCDGLQLCDKSAPAKIRARHMSKKLNGQTILICHETCCQSGISLTSPGKDFFLDDIASG